MNKTQRFMNLEGLRGVAAVVVVVYHFIIMFYPGIAYGHSPTLAPMQNMRYEDNLYGNPLNVFLSGGFAVGIFFILSGFVLSIGFFQTGKESIVKKLAAKRYLRLMLPAFASIMLALIFFALNLDTFRSAATAITHSGTPGVRAFVPDFFDAVRQGTFAIFFNGAAFFSKYNPVLWTMTFEFIGSFIVFAFLLLFGKVKYRLPVYGFLLLATFGTWFLGFILGALLADLYAHGKAPFRQQDRKFIWGALVAGLIFGGYPSGLTAGTLYDGLRLPWMTADANNAIFISVGAALVVLAVLALPSLSRFFASNKVSRLGKYTYSLYLTHFPILITLGMASFVLFSQWVGFNRAVALTVAVTAPVIVAAAWLFERYIDRPSIKLATYTSGVAAGDQKVMGVPQVRAWTVIARQRLMPKSDLDEE